MPFPIRPVLLRLIRLLLPAGMALLIAGCGSVGSKGIRVDSQGYNAAVVDTWNEQMLLNLVRLRYMDTPQFLEITSISTQRVLRGSGNVSFVPRFEGISGLSETTLGGGIAYEERPTITYAPVQGDAFVKRLLSPVRLDALVLLLGSGWQLERLLRCCVQRINDLNNAPSAMDVAPDSIPEYADFLEVAELMDGLVRQQSLRIAIDADGRVISDLVPGGGNVGRLKALLGIPNNARQVHLSANPTRRAPNEIGLLTRSLMAVMFYLSKAVEVPERDLRNGRVRVIQDPEDTVFDWTRVTEGLFRVRSTEPEPVSAFVAVRHRGSWFYIDDSDLESKATFGLLAQLFNLQSGDIPALVPVLTLPVGG